MEAKNTKIKRAVKMFNESRINENEFMEMVFPVIEVTAKKFDDFDTDELVQEFCLKTVERIRNGYRFNADFFIFEMEDKMKRYVASHSMQEENRYETSYKETCEMDESFIIRDVLDIARTHLLKQQQFVIQKYYFEEMTEAEIAKEMNRSTGYIHQLKKDACRRLKRYCRCLAEEY